ncbi:sugar ABC transporter substrate-binding protein [Thalassospira sp. MCCC 1A01428]|nr:sugar ABC transporter substrate-binding protein [Thalassospira sp. MCCC 1A01428]
MLGYIEFFEDYATEIEAAFELSTPDPHLKMAMHLIRQHLEAKPVTATSLVAAAGVPYATAKRRLDEMMASGLVERRPRTATGKSFSLHPAARLIENWASYCSRLRRLVERTFGAGVQTTEDRDYYFGGSYINSHIIQPPQVLAEPLKLAGGLRILVHADPTFMVMGSLKRQFEQVIGGDIHQRAFSIDRLHAETLRNAERRVSRYDMIAVDLPWIGEFAQKNVLLPLDEVVDINSFDPSDFHTAGWRAAHYGGRPYGIPSQTTPELFFYRRDLFAEAGLEAPQTTDEVLHAAKQMHDPQHGRYGIAWNAARGTALGHTFIMTCGDFGQPIFNLNKIAGGFDADNLDGEALRPTIDTDAGRDVAEYLLALMQFSPPDILSMSWYERIRPYASGSVAMAYGYTLLAPYFELDPASPANGNTGYLPHPAGPGAAPIAPVGGYVLGIPANLPPERRAAAAKALAVFTSAEAQKLYVQNGSRTVPRYSVGADPEVRRLSPLFEAVDKMSWRDELQFWPRPPVPQISTVIQICGEEFHDMLRGLIPPKQALAQAQNRVDKIMKQAGTLT